MSESGSKFPDESAHRELTERVDRLVARVEISEVIYRFGRGLDRLDRGLMHSAFHPDSRVDYGEMFSGSGAEFVEFCLKFQQPTHPIAHMVGNVYVAHLDERQATVESYELSHHPAPGGADGDMMFAARLVDRFARRGDEWRIVHRTKIADWARVLAGSDDLLSSMPVARARRDSYDPSYALLDPANPTGRTTDHDPENGEVDDDYANSDH